MINDFNIAWMHHYHVNKHHPENWVLIDKNKYNKSYKLIPTTMDSIYIVEMICDWESFYYYNGEKLDDTAYSYYYNKDHKDGLLYDITREKLEYLLKRMQDKKIK